VSYTTHLGELVKSGLDRRDLPGSDTEACLILVDPDAGALVFVGGVLEPLRTGKVRNPSQDFNSHSLIDSEGPLFLESPDCY